MLTRVSTSAHVHATVLKNSIHHPDGSIEHRCPFHGAMTHTGHPRHVCEYCWCMYYMALDATIPSDKRGEARERLLAVMMEAGKLEERGEFDLQIDRHPQVEIDLTADTPQTPEGAEPLNL